MDISFVVPNRNNLKYFKWSYDSIRKNQGNHTVWICSAVDACTDGTLEYYEELARTDPHFKYIVNPGLERLGHTVLYDKIVWELVETDIAIIWHCDMYLCPGALDEVEKLMCGRTLKSFERCELYESGKYTRSVKMGGPWMHWKADKQNDTNDFKVHSWLDRWAPSVPKYEFENRNAIVSLTRIEPPLHPIGYEKIIADFGTEPENFDEVGLLTQISIFQKLEMWKQSQDNIEIDVPLKGITNGVFAPWAFWVDEYKNIGGHDWLFMPQSREDDDIWNRFFLNGTEFIQTRQGFVYHLTCRGNRRNVLDGAINIHTDNPEWQQQNIKSMRNFIRKWGYFVKHDQWHRPIISKKYNKALIIKNATYNLLANLEPWFDHIEVDLPANAVMDYITAEQSNTKFDLKDRVDYLPSNLEERSDIVCYIDGNRFAGDDFYNIQMLSDILTENQPEENSEFQLGNIRLKVNKIKIYEHELIVVENEPINL